MPRQLPMKTTSPRERSEPLKLSVRVITLAIAASAMTFGAQAQPAKATQFYDEALKLYEKNDLTGTALQLKNAIRVDQKLLAAHLLLGRVLIRTGEYKAAEASPTPRRGTTARKTSHAHTTEGTVADTS